MIEICRAACSSLFRLMNRGETANNWIIWLLCNINLLSTQAWHVEVLKASVSVCIVIGSDCSNYSMGCTSRQLWFDSWLWQQTYFLSTTSALALALIQTSIERVLRSLLLGVKRPGSEVEMSIICWGYERVELYFHSPICLYDMHWDDYLYFINTMVP